MKHIAIFIMGIMLNRAKKDMTKCDNTIVTSAYGHMIRSYEVTILYLKSNK